ncbi:MAG: Arm DNA-binding domain-containing protein [Rhodospirillaceae bacterium]|nr:Arm DNA-binding domain-containing protein [Rhodospirillaceae bacterium]
MPYTNRSSSSPIGSSSFHAFRFDPTRLRNDYGIPDEDLPLKHVAEIEAMPGKTGLTISKRTVDALTAEGGDAVFWDRDLPGFGVRVYPSGRKVYVVQSRGPRGPRRVTLGPHGELAAGTARRRAADVIDRIKRGEAPAPPEPEPVPTVAGLAERYMEAHVAVNCNAHRGWIYRGSRRNHLLPALGTLPIDEVGRTEAAALHYGLRDTPRAANRALMVLSKMFSLAEMPSGLASEA